ncbi:MAG: hypothetical protein V3R87_04485, partial [Dehalococcoidia bacterium]
MTIITTRAQEHKGGSLGEREGGRTSGRVAGLPSCLLVQVDQKNSFKNSELVYLPYFTYLKREGNKSYTSGANCLEGRVSRVSPARDDFSLRAKGLAGT